MRSSIATSHFTRAGRAPVAILALALALASPAWAPADDSFGIAALPPQRPARGISSPAEQGVSHTVGVPRTRPEALTLMHRVAARLERPGGAAAERDQLMTELEAALRFARWVDRGGIDEGTFQWHRAGTADLQEEQGSTLIRPLSGIRFVSAVAVGTPGGGVMIDRVRVYSASGVVFEFGTDHPRMKRRGGREVYLLDREMELVGVEVIYRREPGTARGRVAVEGGISVKPRYAAECAYRLQLARQSVFDGRYSLAIDRVRESIALLASVR